MSTEMNDTGGKSANDILDRAWMIDAACRDGNQTSRFFAPVHFERKEHRITRENMAKRICANCDVRQECLEYAVTTNENHGIWGGQTEDERHGFRNHTPYVARLRTEEQPRYIQQISRDITS